MLVVYRGGPSFCFSLAYVGLCSRSEPSKIQCYVFLKLNLRNTSTVVANAALRITGTWMVAIFGGLLFPFVLSFKAAAGPCFACFCVLKRAKSSHKFILYSLSQSKWWMAGWLESTFEHVRECKSTQSPGIARKNDGQTENLEIRSTSSSTSILLYQNLQYCTGTRFRWLTVVTGSSTGTSHKHLQVAVNLLKYHRSVYKICYSPFGLFLRYNSTCFPRTSGCHVLTNRFWTSLDLRRFSSTIFILSFKL